MKKRILSLILAICCVLTLLPMAAVRADAARLTRQEFGGDRTLNPLYEDVLSLDNLPPAPERLPNREPDAAGVHEHEVARPLNDVSDFVPAMDAVALIRDQLVAREEEFTIQFAMVSNMTVEEGAAILLDLAMAHTGVANEGDYLRWQWLTFDFDGQYWEDSYEDLYYVDVTYYMTYFTTAEQEAEMDEAVETLLTDLDLEGKTDYVKISGIYDYICDNVTYDFEHLEDPEYYLMFSAYAALIDKTAVCQGYALLLYRLALELGVDTRIIVGVQTSTAIPHAWNIVKLRNQYYNLDSTWDAGMPEYQFFLRTEADFVDHTREPAYNTSDFHQYYPMATEAFEPNISGSLGSNITWTLDGMTGEMVVEGTGETTLYPKLHYISRDVFSLKISEGITHLNANAFTDFVNLAQVELPDSLTKIGNEVFNGTGLVEVYIPDSVTSIGGLAFANCPNLESIRFPKDLKEIPSGVCSGNKSLKSVELPENLVTIWDVAFENCENLESIVLPETVEMIFANAFSGCTALKKIRIPASVIRLDSNALDSAEEVYFVGDQVVRFSPVHALAEDAKIYYPRDNEIWLEYIASFPDRNWIPYDPPAYIVGQPQDATAAEDTETTFTVTAGGQGLTYQWQWKAAGTYTWTNSSNGNTDTLKVVGASHRNGYQYRCVVTDQFGNKVTSKPAELFVVPILIREQPENIETIDGVAVEFKVAADGKDLTYQWQWKAANSYTWANSSNGNTNTLTVTGAVHRNGYQYRCIITDAKGRKLTTEVVTLTVVETPALEIYRQPGDALVPIGGTAEFRVGASGDQVTYQWQWKKPDSNTWKNSSNGTETRLTVEALEYRDGYQYRCVVTDRYGQTVTSDVATLTIDRDAIKFDALPENKTVMAGEMSTLTVFATHNQNGSLFYQWQWRADETGEWENCLDGNQSYLSVNPLPEHDGYQYRCVISDDMGNEVTTNVCTLIVLVLEIEVQPADQTVAENETATFSVVVPGEGLRYQWQWRPDPYGNWTNSSNGNTNTLQVVGAAHRNGYQYRCVITNSLGRSVTSDTAILTVVGDQVLTILEQPKDVEGKVGEKAQFYVKVQGEGLTYQWQWTEGAYKWNDCSNGNTDTLTVDVAAHRNGYHYRCVITDANGKQVISDVAILRVKEDTPLAILEQPKDAEGKLGEKVQFYVRAQGDGLTYQWQWTDGKNGWKNSSNGNTDTLTVEVAAHRIGYQYRCVITDASGNQVTTDAATLRLWVESTIVILEQPKDAEGKIGDVVTFSVKAEGEGLTYQWQWKKPNGTWANSSNGNTDSLTVEVAAHRIGYQYRCVITDANGAQVITDTATLLKTPTELRITKQPEQRYFPSNEDIVITVEAEGDGLTYAWYSKYSMGKAYLMENFTTNELRLEPDTHYSGMTVWCVITDQYGNQVTSDQVTIQIVGSR